MYIILIIIAIISHSINYDPLICNGVFVFYSTSCSTIYLCYFDANGKIIMMMMMMVCYDDDGDDSDSNGMVMVPV